MLSPEESAVVKKGFSVLEATLTNATIRNFDCDNFCCYQEAGRTQGMSLVYTKALVEKTGQWKDQGWNT